jgi:hypothetical protein
MNELRELNVGEIETVAGGEWNGDICPVFPRWPFPWPPRIDLGIDPRINVGIVIGSRG